MSTASPTHDLHVRTERLESCPNCGGAGLAPWRRGFDRLHGLSRQEFVYSRCKGCGLIFLSLRPSEDEVSKFYPENYGPYQGASGAAAPAEVRSPRGRRLLGRLSNRLLSRSLGAVNRGVDRLFPDTFAEEFRRLYLPPHEGAKLLDFGCGSDVLLNWAREQGWDTTGMDFAENSVEQVRRSGHRGLLLSGEVWGEIEDESLDFVRMNHVLEHLYHPREVLAALKSKMKPGATLHVGVPNPDSLTSKVFRSRWWGLECPRHVILYSPTMLRKLLSEMGFHVHTVLHETLTKDCARSLGYLMCDRGWIEREEVEAMVRERGLADLLHAPERLAALLGRADRFHVFARK